MSCLRDKRCLITGAAGGIGAALSRRLAKAGCRLLLTGRDESKLADLAGELGDKAQGVYPADLADAAQVEDLVTRVGRDGVDILVNNAGVFPVLCLEDSTPDELDRCLAVNLRAPFVLARAFAGGMKTRPLGPHCQHRLLVGLRGLPEHQHLLHQQARPAGPEPLAARRVEGSRSALLFRGAGLGADRDGAPGAGAGFQHLH
jgi:3-oxoacyl-[acyl-carrier protein] reductase